MNKNCEITRDLLPLYIDGVCSTESAEFVEDHLENCNECKNFFKKMKDDSVESELKTEKGGIIKKQADYIRRKSVIVGMIISGIFLIPVVTCLIVDICVGTGLDFFFIVLASLILASSLTVVPLVVSKNKFLITLLSSFLSLELLLVVCDIYSNASFSLVALPSVLFGVSVVFLPIAVNKKPISDLLKNHKALTVFSLDLFFYILMMFCIGLHVKSSDYNALSFGLSLPCILFTLGVFVSLRYLPNVFLKTGSTVFLCGIFFFFESMITGFLINSPVGFPKMDFSNGFTDNFDGNIRWVCLLASALVFAVLTVIGVARINKSKKK